ncbi:MAG: flagellar export chaperone FliS [Planctomycetota bacterium]
MSDSPLNEYLKAKIMTATPQQLQTMLYDGAIRFCEQARQAMLEEDIPTTHERIVRAQRIVVELSSTMNAEVNPELCGRLASLYTYVYRLLVDANVQRDPAKIDEALGLLQHIRETWLMALNKLREDAAMGDETPAPAPPAAPEATGGPGGILSIEG